MANILNTILTTKHREIALAKDKISLAKIKNLAQQMPICRPFTQTLLDNINAKKTTVIAEIKKASPSKGIIRKDFNPQKLAISYQDGGASCLSVLTDKEFFMGDDNFIANIKKVVNIPILRKDFIIDEYQVYQSRILGADCILLIVAALDDSVMLELTNLAYNLGMSVLVEVHNKNELMRALKLDLAIIGINNRDLKTFNVSLDTTIELLEYIPDNISVITESAIFTNADINKMRQYLVYGFLVGESLMRQNDVELALKNLIAI